MSNQNQNNNKSQFKQIVFETVANYLVNITWELVNKAYNCLYIQDSKIHSVDGLLSNASAYIKSAKVVADKIPPGYITDGAKTTLREVIRMLEAIENFKYEGSKFEKAIDKKGFEYKFFKVRHHARVLRNRIKELVK